uniref:DUF4781 domain-containing protein n=1 Tax=Parastrongyloides trichosuri TaxID=131310 RepID=A0A0N4Z6S8_PARTI
MTEQKSVPKNNQDPFNVRLADFYSSVVKTPVGRYVELGYYTAKKSNPYIESTVNTLESGIACAANSYIIPTASKVYNRYNDGVDKTKEAANVSSAYGVTVLVAGLQLGLLASFIGANMALDAARATKQIGSNSLKYIYYCKNSASLKIKNTLDKSIEVVAIPKNMASEQMSYLLDITTAYVEKMTEKEVPKDKLNESSTVYDKFSALIKFLVSNAYEKRPKQLVDPLVHNLFKLMEKIKNNFLLLDMLRNGEWVKGSYFHVSEYLTKAKKVIEEKADVLNVSPEHLLLEQIRTNTDKLDKSTDEIRQKSQNVLTPQINEFLNKIIEMIRNFDHTIKNGKTVYEVKDEVIHTIINSLSFVLSFISPSILHDNKKDENDKNIIEDNKEKKEFVGMNEMEVKHLDDKKDALIKGEEINDKKEEIVKDEETNDKKENVNVIDDKKEEAIICNEKKEEVNDVKETSSLSSSKDSRKESKKQRKKRSNHSTSESSGKENEFFLSGSNPLSQIIDKN